MKKFKRITCSLAFLLLLANTNISYGASYKMHTVEEGESYYQIATENNISYQSLMATNGTTSEYLVAGNLIKIEPMDYTISIYLNDSKLYPDSNPYLSNDRTFVPIRFIAEALNATVSWDEVNQIAIIESNDKTIELPINAYHAYVNGEAYQLDAPTSLYEGRTFVPVRFVSEILGCEVSWDDNTYSVLISADSVTTSTVSSTKSYTADDLYWLSRIVEAEASGESYEGKLAVANVVLNRVAESSFSDTIYGVIFEKSNGYYQFTPAANGTIYNTPSQSSEQAAESALNGVNNISDALFFVNPDKTSLSWIQSYRTFFKSIGDHDFYL
jgi:LysM repeat protein